MISLIEAKNFRCLRYIRQPLGPFHVLVGPNASGKTTFLDVIGFLGQLVSEGLEEAIRERTTNFQDLLWGRAGEGFELAIEAKIPEERRKMLRDKKFDRVRYEIVLATDKETGEVMIQAEKGVLLHPPAKSSKPEQRTLFPIWHKQPATIVTKKGVAGTQTLFNKFAGGNDNFYSEVYQEKGKGWTPSFKLGPRKSALGNLPALEGRFPVSTWLRDLLAAGVQRLMLNSLLIRQSSRPGQVRGFKPDGSNLPGVIEQLRDKHPDKFRNWLEHVRTALPNIEDIRTVEREDDKHRYLVLCYTGGLEVPSWMASDGTLRLLALTLPAYLPDFQGVYLIEEPENGIHPRAVATVCQSLSSVYNAQILLATHSPVILGMVKPADVLCFKARDGATDIVSGNEHPALKEWRGETNLGTLFAGGVLG